MAMQCVKTGCYFRHGDMALNACISGDLFWDNVTNEIMLVDCSDVFTTTGGPDIVFDGGKILPTHVCLEYIARNNPEFREAWAKHEIKLILITYDRFSFVSGWLQHR